MHSSTCWWEKVALGKKLKTQVAEAFPRHTSICVPMLFLLLRTESVGLGVTAAHLCRGEEEEASHTSFPSLSPAEGEE